MLDNYDGLRDRAAKAVATTNNPDDLARIILKTHSSFKRGLARLPQSLSNLQDVNRLIFAATDSNIHVEFDVHECIQKLDYVYTLFVISCDQAQLIESAWAKLFLGKQDVKMPNLDQIRNSVGMNWSNIWEAAQKAPHMLEIKTQIWDFYQSNDDDFVTLEKQLDAISQEITKINNKYSVLIRAYYALANNRDINIQTVSMILGLPNR